MMQQHMNFCRRNKNEREECLPEGGHEPPHPTRRTLLDPSSCHYPPEIVLLLRYGDRKGLVYPLHTVPSLLLIAKLVSGVPQMIPIVVEVAPRFLVNGQNIDNSSLRFPESIEDNPTAVLDRV